MKKVLVFKSDLLTRSETFIKEQILSYSQWDAKLYGFRKIAQGLSMEDLDYKIIRKGYSSFLQRKIWKFLDFFCYWPSPLVMEIKRENFSLIHAHFGPNGILAWPLAKRLGIPIIVTLHGYDINTHKYIWEAGTYGISGRFYPKRLMDIARKGVNFIAVSDAIRQKAIAFGIPESLVTVKYIGIDVDYFKPNEIPVSKRAKRILFVANLIEKKGCEYLIQAFSTVIQNIPNAELIIVGDGPLRFSLESLAIKLGLSITFTGALAKDEVKMQMDKARVFCLPSITAMDGNAEGLGIVLLEAQASGVPAVTSALGGSTEGIIDGETGFAFNEKDVVSLAKSLEIILLDDALAERMSAAAVAFMRQRFNIKSCTRDLEAYYDSRLI